MTAVAGNPTRTAFWSRANRLCKPASLLIMAAADAAAFTTSDFLFRVHMQVPVLVTFLGTRPGHHRQAIDVFSILAIIFIFTRFIFGDYSRRELFWDSARTTSRALIVASVPDLLLMLLGIRIYSVSAILSSWLFLLFAVPVYR